MANLEELRARQTEVKARLSEIHNEHLGEYLDPESEEGREWNSLNEETEALDRTIEQLEKRHARIQALNEEPESREHQFSVPRPRAKGESVFDLSSIDRNRGPEAVRRELHDRARTALEDTTIAHERADEGAAKAHVERLLKTRDDEAGSIAQRMLVTGSPLYARGFGKTLLGQRPTPEEDRALSAGTTTAGGFAVPFALDPTIIPTSNLSVNPYRAIARVETITVSKWEGVTSAGVTASFSSEATEASDNAPALDQPTVTPPKAQAFIPYSIEIGQDWGGLQSEMARLLQDAKDDLEASRFTFGTASTPEPEGVIKAGTAFVSTASSATFAIADLYSLEQALGPRFRPRASFIANRAIYNKVRQFDTAGGAGLWVRVGEGLPNNVPTPGSLGNNLLGYPSYEVSPMTTAVTSNSLFLMIGDFSYFVVVDRIGMNVELIPHLFGGSNRFPTGQRGLYCYWRTGSVVTSTNAFKILKAL